MDFDWVQIFTALAGVIAGGGLVKLFTIRAERTKIIGEGEVSQANAAKTYHEISMDLIQEFRLQLADLKGRLSDASVEITKLQVKVHELNVLLEERDRELALLKGRL